MRDFNRKWLTAGVLIGLLLPGLAWGQAFEVTPGATSAQEQPAIAALPNLNQFLVAWQDFQAGTLLDISGQLVNANGTPSGTKITISTAANDQTAASVAYNSATNQFLVVWQTFQAGTLLDISGQLVNANGTLAGAEISISTAANDQAAPAVAYNSTANQFLVVWQTFQAGTLLDISGQLVNANGILAGGEIAISTAANDQTVPAVGYNSTANQFLVVWQTFQAGTLLDISGQLVNADGILAGGEIAISTAANDQTVPAVGYNSTANQFLVVWQDFQAGTLLDISGQLVNANGTLSGTKITISNAANDQTAPAVAYNSTANQFLVVWEDLSGGGSFTDIFGQRVNPDGSLSGVNFMIPSAAPLSDRAAPALAFNVNANQFVVVWQDAQGALTTDIVGQVTGGGGTATPPSVVVTAPNGTQTLTVGVSFTITWTSSDSDGIAPTQEILLSKDGGLTFPTIIATGLAGTLQSFPWTPTSTDTTTEGRIRITATDLLGAIGRDASNANFTIAVAGAGGGALQGECAIATAAFGSPLAAEVNTLRAFRDRYLLAHPAGRWAVAAYYRVSPPLADLIRQHEALRGATRISLRPLVWWAGLALRSPILAITVMLGTTLGGVVIFGTFALRGCRRPRGPRRMIRGSLDASCSSCAGAFTVQLSTTRGEGSH